MINIPAIFIANGAGILLMCSLLVSQRAGSARRGFLDGPIYHHMVVMTIMQCVLEPATFLLDGQVFPGCRALLYALNSALFIINILFSFTWTLYADYKLFGDPTRLKKIYPFVAIPALVVVAGAIVNLFTPVFYVISPENVYRRTNLFPLPYLITYAYLAYGTILIYCYRDRVKKYLFLPAMTFILPILIGSVMQYLFYGLSLVWLGVAIGMTSLYINVQNEFSYTDPLSGLFNRPYLSSYITQQVKRHAPNTRVAGIMLDIDRFKSINDSYGHAVGDHAIADVGRILRGVVKDGGIAARYGGDEFVVIRTVRDEAELQEIVQRLTQKAEEYNREQADSYALRFSLGCTLFQDGKDTIDSFLKRMDEHMYCEKREKIRDHRLPERRRRPE